MINITSSHI